MSQAGPRSSEGSGLLFLLSGFKKRMIPLHKKSKSVEGCLYSSVVGLECKIVVSFYEEVYDSTPMKYVE